MQISDPLGRSIKARKISVPCSLKTSGPRATAVDGRYFKASLSAKTWKEEVVTLRGLHRKPPLCVHVSFRINNCASDELAELRCDSGSGAGAHKAPTLRYDPVPLSRTQSCTPSVKILTESLHSIDHLLIFYAHHSREFYWEKKIIYRD